MKFPTKYDKRPKPKSVRGTRYMPIYQEHFDEFGHMELVESGKKDMLEYIQSNKDVVDIYNILERFANGNAEILEQVKGVYADVSNMPVKLQDVLNLNIRAKDAFDRMPVEVKELYGNNYYEFLLDPERAEKTLSASGNAAASVSRNDDVSDSKVKDVNDEQQEH